MCNLSEFEKLDLLPQHRSWLEEEFELWHEHYLPPEGVKDNLVCDIGAGCGETVQLYLNHGAGTVVAFERDRIASRKLVHNFLGDKRVLILEGVDFCKIDVDGSERNWLIETHNDLGFKAVRTEPYSTLWKIVQQKKVLDELVAILAKRHPNLRRRTEQEQAGES
jgi:16S rRNA A1518/A1519 N6-dimethyltransferase RsmA/KsgA/DIM1 with predicted DNA glycosylase/AP lyase activity